MRISPPALVFSTIVAHVFGLTMPTAGSGQEAQEPPQEGEPRSASLYAVEVEANGPKVSFDGSLDDAAWTTAPVAEDFLQREPNTGEPASEPTEVRILIDGDVLYVGARMYDSRPDSIVAPLTRRDDDAFSDWFYVGFDSNQDGRTAYLFGINPRGVKRDVRLFEDWREDPDWDAVWDAAVAIDSLGWSAELRIPLSQLRLDPKTIEGLEPAWGVDFQRRLARREEIAHWSEIPRRGRPMVSLFKKLHGIEGISPPRRFEIQPYSVGRMTLADVHPNDPFHEADEITGTGGLDLKYGLTPSMTLTATVNPDFGQVEADPSVVNTSGYRTFLPEKRPFFLEDAELFDYRIGNARLFHSRRIGREPQREVNAPDGFVDAPEASNIIGAVKVTGRTNDGWSIGLLNATTRAEHALVADSLGVQHAEPVEPLTNSSVARVIREFAGGNASIGLVSTGTVRKLDEELDFIPRAAFTAGADFRVADADYEFNAAVIGSAVYGSPEALVRLQRAQGRFL
ncbi:MAG: hypothetical protein GEU90_06390, partial [Gemmatimonas sp.]|nr:hypothetical protein [Gemmatimonas sp.]